MKKILCLFIALIIAIVAVGCVYNGDGDVSEKEDKEILTVITVKDGEYSQNFEVKYGDVPTIEAFTKIGYYLLGYFSAQEGGEKYFDSAGKATVVWDAMKPTVLYAQWDSIYNLTDAGSRMLYTTPESFSCVGTHYLSTYNLSNEFVNAVKGNLGAQINVTVNFGIKGGSQNKYYRFTFYDITDKATRQLLFADYSIEAGMTNSSNYTDFSISGTFTANMVLSQKIVMYGSAGWEGSINTWAIRQLTWTLKFVE